MRYFISFSHSLILGPLLTPKFLISHKGHLFCKACIYTSLLDQKKANKKRLKAWEELNKSTEALEKARQELEAQKKIKAFEMQTTTLITSETTGKMDQQSSTKSWWLPNEAPEAAASLGAKPSNDTFCPRSGHVIRLKDLTVVDFKHEKPLKKVEDSQDIDKRATGTDFICHVCSKDLKSVSKVIMIRPCGHAFCYKCCDEFAKSKCPVCDNPCIDSKSKIQLQPPASSFAEGGATIAKRETPSAIVM